MRRKKQKIPVHFAEDHRKHRIPIPIREVRPGYYLLDLIREGRRERKGFGDLEDAKLYALQKHIEIKNRGMDAFTLSDSARRDAVDALKILGGAASLRTVAEEYVRRHPPKGAETISFTAWRYLRAMMKRGARPLSVKDKLFKFRVYVRAVGPDTPTASIDAKDVERWIAEKGYRGHSAQGYRRSLVALLNFYHGKLKVRQNGDDAVPVVWKPATVRRLFRAAEEHERQIIPTLTLMLFAGIRPYEAMRLRWEDVNLHDKHVVLGPEITKTRTARTVDLSANALEWLMKHHANRGLVSGGQFIYRRRREKIMEKAGVESWPVDVARHTFATAHYVEYQDASKTMSQLGHFGNPSTFTRHYKGLLSRKEASEFWSITPSKKGEIIRMTESA